jgi:hypothetical protein
LFLQLEKVTREQFAWRNGCETRRVRIGRLRFALNPSDSESVSIEWNNQSNLVINGYGDRVLKKTQKRGATRRRLRDETDLVPLLLDQGERYTV